MDKNLFNDLCKSIEEASAMKNDRSKYVGLTYPKIFNNRLVHKLWKRFMCKDGKHLFDEVLTYHTEPMHYLWCDACELEVHISCIAPALQKIQELDDERK